MLTWTLVATWAAWAIVRTFGLERGAPLVGLIAFTPYVAATAVIPIAVALFLRRWAAAAVAVLVAVVLVAAVLPRAFGGPTDAAGGNGPELRVLAANMKLGEGDPETLVGLVRSLDVDVLSVEELTPRLAAELDAAGLRTLLPERELRTGEDSSGSGLYAREGFGGGSAQTLAGGFPLIRESLRIPGAAPVEVFSVHTASPVDPAWRQDLESLPGASEAIPQIMIGDFNSTLDHDAFRELLDRGYEDAAETLGDGLAPTWPSSRRVLPALVAIDHVLVDPRIGVRDFSTHEIPRSDHRAVFAELTLPLSR